MKARLLHPHADFPWQWAKQAAAERSAGRTGYRSYRPEGFDPRAGLPWNAEDLLSDLSLLPVLEAMAQGDDWIFEVSRRVLLEATRADLDTIRYRQAVLQDCLRHAEVVRSTSSWWRPPSKSASRTPGCSPATRTGCSGSP